MYWGLYNRNAYLFPHSCLITGFVARVTRRVPLVEQKLLTIPEHLRLPFSAFSVVRVSRVFCIVFCTPLFVICHFSFALSVLLQFTAASDFSFGIFKLYSLQSQDIHIIFNDYWFQNVQIQGHKFYGFPNIHIPESIVYPSNAKNIALL
jgi:hypothetical protein